MGCRIEEGNRMHRALPIPAQSATEGKAFSLYLADFFADSGSDSLIYSINGLPAGTGFKVDALTGLSNHNYIFRDPHSLFRLTIFNFIKEYSLG